jgi:hypothetical protein
MVRLGKVDDLYQLFEHCKAKPSAVSKTSEDKCELSVPWWIFAAGFQASLPMMPRHIFVPVSSTLGW